MYEKGKIVKGTITGIEEYGAFVSLENDYCGLIHISEISHGYVKNINDFIKVGETINVQIIDVDEDSLKLKLSIKNIFYKNKPRKNKKIINETKTGFKNLGKILPLWIEEAKKMQKIK